MAEYDDLRDRAAELRRRWDRELETARGTDREAAFDVLCLETSALLERLAALAVEARFGALAERLLEVTARASTTAERARLALEVCCDAVRAGRGFVVVFADEEARILAQHPPAINDTELRPKLSRALLSQVLDQGRSIRVSDPGDIRFSKETSVVGLDFFRSVLVSPLLNGEAGWGALYLEGHAGSIAFSAADQGLVEAVARMLSPLISSNTPAAPAASATLLDPRVGELIGTSKAVVQLRATVTRLGASDVPVLIEGESGTGKELVARALHFGGLRKQGPFVAVNCAALPDTLIESELFGHERGAFTGATERKLGRFELAHGGTLFLDEIGEIRYELQAKLLRVLQEHAFNRVGGAHTVEVDVRLVAASNRNLRQMVAEGGLREDLFYRLAVVPIEVPALRERPEDVPLLVRHFLADFRARTGRAIEFEREVITALSRYRFPGNVRELRNLVERLCTLADGDRVLSSDLPNYVVGDGGAVSMDKDPFRRYFRNPPGNNDDLKEAKLAMAELYELYVKKLEAGFVRSLLAKADGSVSEAARLAGMNRTMFHRKLREAELFDGDRTGEDER